MMTHDYSFNFELGITSQLQLENLVCLVSALAGFSLSPYCAMLHSGNMLYPLRIKCKSKSLSLTPVPELHNSPVGHVGTPQNLSKRKVEALAPVQT
jgi:hypothetical protein